MEPEPNPTPAAAAAAPPETAPAPDRPVTYERDQYGDIRGHSYDTEPVKFSDPIPTEIALAPDPPEPVAASITYERDEYGNIRGHVHDTEPVRYGDPVPQEVVLEASDDTTSTVTVIYERDQYGDLRGHVYDTEPVRFADTNGRSEPEFAEVIVVDADDEVPPVEAHLVPLGEQGHPYTGDFFDDDRDSRAPAPTPIDLGTDAGDPEA